MPDEISTQMLAQTSDNIQKLFDLSTRIDERVKNIQEKQNEFSARVAELALTHMSMMQKIAVLESHKLATDEEEEEIHNEINTLEIALLALDKRLTTIEGENGHHKARWNRIFSFVVQLVWVILAAYLLTKLHLQAPSVP